MNLCFDAKIHTFNGISKQNHIFVTNFCRISHIFVTNFLFYSITNYDELLKKAKFSILKNPQGTAEYNYKDKDGVLILTIDEDGENVQSTAK